MSFVLTRVTSALIQATWESEMSTDLQPVFLGHCQLSSQTLVFSLLSFLCDLYSMIPTPLLVLLLNPPLVIPIPRLINPYVFIFLAHIFSNAYRLLKFDFPQGKWILWIHAIVFLCFKYIKNLSGSSLLSTANAEQISPLLPLHPTSYTFSLQTAIKIIPIPLHLLKPLAFFSSLSPVIIWGAHIDPSQIFARCVSSSPCP